MQYVQCRCVTVRVIPAMLSRCHAVYMPCIRPCNNGDITRPLLYYIALYNRIQPLTTLYGVDRQSGKVEARSSDMLFITYIIII